MASVADFEAATPLVAGVLATFLSYHTVPFATTGGQTATAAKKYLQDTANWQRQKNVPVIWNGVTEANNPKKVAANAPASTTPTAPYATGTCNIQLNQWQAAMNENGNYGLEVSMTDNDGTQIGYTQRLNDYEFSDSKPLGFQSKLEDILYCKPEQKNDYIAFAAGTQAWPSDGKLAPGAVSSCTTSNWSEDTAHGLEIVSRCIPWETVAITGVC